MKKQSGFTLIELMIVVAIIAILAAIALPAYQSYVRESRYADLQTAVSGLKTNLEVCFAKKGDLSLCDTEADLGVTFPATNDNFTKPTITATANTSTKIVAEGSNAVGGTDCVAEATVSTLGNLEWKYSNSSTGTASQVVGCKYKYDTAGS